MTASMCSGVGDEIGRNIAAVELHTFDVFFFEFETLGFFNGDDAIFADFVHHFGDQITDLRGPGQKWWRRWQCLLWW